MDLSSLLPMFMQTNNQNGSPDLSSMMNMFSGGNQNMQPNNMMNMFNMFNNINSKPAPPPREQTIKEKIVKENMQQGFNYGATQNTNNTRKNVDNIRDFAPPDIMRILEMMTHLNNRNRD
ncbi:MAG: hypothetical protein R3Y23_05915 [Bacillota bacterium]